MSPNATVVWVCEFFFTNFWHWLALVLVVGALGGSRYYRREG